MKTKDDPKRLIGEVQILRIRVATAESEVKVLREQALQAKRRRKAAKRMALRARKQYKRFKTELTELQQTLAKAETKLFQAGGRALARKAAKARLVAKRGNFLSNASKTVALKPRPALPPASREPGRTKMPPITEGPADVPALNHTNTSNPRPQFVTL